MTKNAWGEGALHFGFLEIWLIAVRDNNQRRKPFRHSIKSEKSLFLYRFTFTFRLMFAREFVCRPQGIVILLERTA